MLISTFTERNDGAFVNKPDHTLHANSLTILLTFLVYLTLLSVPKLLRFIRYLIVS